MIKQGNVYYYSVDGLGSITNLTDSSGQVVESYSYDEYGNVSAPSQVGNRYLYTGREYDQETGLYYYRARYYDPTIGRFLQTDPVGYEGGINLYSYCRNNPTNWTDPFGLETWWWMNPAQNPAPNVNSVVPNDPAIPQSPNINTTPFPQQPITNPQSLGGYLQGKALVDYLKALADREKYPTWPAVPAPKEEEGHCLGTI